MIITKIRSNWSNHVNSWVRRGKGEDSPKNQPPWTQECTHTHTHSILKINSIITEGTCTSNTHTHTSTSLKKTICINLQQRYIYIYIYYTLGTSNQSTLKKRRWIRPWNDQPKKPNVGFNRRFLVFHRWNPPKAWVRLDRSCFKKTSKNLAVTLGLLCCCRKGCLLGCFGGYIFLLVLVFGFFSRKNRSFFLNDGTLSDVIPSNEGEDSDPSEGLNQMLHQNSWQMAWNSWNGRLACTTLPETNSKSTRKWMVGILISFWGPAYFQGRAVSFREGFT